MEFFLLAIGAALGWLTNLWFERRSLRQSQQENDRLREELARVQSDLARMRSTILSLGGDEPAARSDPSGTPVDLHAQLAERARQLQDADGRVREHKLTADFVARGFARRDVKATIASLIDGDGLEREGAWLRPR